MLIYLSYHWTIPTPVPADLPSAGAEYGFSDMHVVSALQMLIFDAGGLQIRQNG
jgi:hypothetical protein